jgi:uncharacterized protein YoxC
MPQSLSTTADFLMPAAPPLWLILVIVTGFIVVLLLIFLLFFTIGFSKTLKQENDESKEIIAQLSKQIKGLRIHMDRDATI